MSDPVAGDTQAQQPLNSFAEMIERAVEAAKEGAQDAKQAVEDAMPAASRFVSRLVYTTCYSLSYGVVFSTVFVARAIPKENALVHGLVDGAHAAMEKVDEWQSRHPAAARDESSHPATPS
jgi:hypothetical protein